MISGYRQIISYSSTGKRPWKKNNKQFRLSRSTDGKTYTQIAILAAHGAVGGHYTYDDHTPKKGINYYKLEQQGQDGKTAALGIRAAAVNPDKTTNWSIYANPVAEGNDLTIVLPPDQARTSKQEVSIYDISGRKIYSQALQPAGNKLTVSLPVRPVPGVYIVVVNGLEAKKFIIN